MAYRGDDLDIRTSVGRGARETYGGEDTPGLNGASWRQKSPGAGNRGEPLYVDDTVLACCNHAYDVAHAHGAAEVRLEHLVHALTRVEAAAAILEQRGIREGQLRRESAAVIASEIPVGAGHSQGAPRAAAEFTDVLRRAGDHAGSRGIPATVHDLLWVLLNYKRDIPAIAMLIRHAPDWQEWDWPHRREPERRERSSARRETVYVERPRPEPQTVYVERPAPAPQTVYVERSRSEPVVVEAPRTRAEPQQVYVAPNLEPVHDRLDQMDTSLRQLHSEIAGDRRAFTDLIRELQRDLASGRGTGNAFPSKAMFDRFQSIESKLEQRLGDLTETAGALTTKLHSLERTVTSSTQEGARNWAHVGERLKTVDQTLAGGVGGAPIDLSNIEAQIEMQLEAIGQRMASFEKTLETRTGENQRAWASIGDRLRSLDEATGAHKTELAGVKSSIATGQGMDPAATQSAVAPLMERLRQIEAGLERRGGDSTQTMRALDQRLAAMEQRFNTLHEGAGQTESTHLQQLGELHEAIMKLGSNQQTFSATFDQWRTDNGGDIGVVANQLTAMEQSVGKPQETLNQLIAEMRALQRVSAEERDHLIHLSESVNTTAANMQALQEATTQGRETLARLTSDVQSLQRVTVEDIDVHQAGFKRWLFGTHDIFASSWRTEADEIRERVASLRAQRKG